jgi:hypothetical protein
VTNETNHIICTFVNQQDNSKKSCNATYAPCGGAQQPQIAYNDTSESRLVLTLMLADQIEYCYTVNASNNTVSVIIEGTITGIEDSITGSECSSVIDNNINIICHIL